MLIIADKKIPTEAKSRLRSLGSLLELETKGITYPAISGHPDIFLTQVDGRLVVAPNLPEQHIIELRKQNIELVFGEQRVGPKYPQTAGFNAVVATKSLIHNLNTTDPLIRNLCKNKTPVHVNQGYTRCNLVFLDDDHAITSDRGIYKTLTDHGVETLLVNPSGINLPGFEHGFFGGCCGIYDNRLFILGSLKYYQEGAKIRQFVSDLQSKIVELFDSPLFDGGGVMFVEG